MDIKISLEIGLSPALEAFLGKVLGNAPAPQSRQPQKFTASVDTTLPPEIGDVQDDNPSGVAESPEPGAQRRTRRTKAQMEVDAAAQATDQSGSQSPEATDGSKDGSTATTAASPTDLAGALDAAEGGEVTKAQVQAKAKAVLEHLGNSGGTVKRIQEALAAACNGATSMSTLNPADYGRAAAVLDGLLAEPKA